MTEDDPLKFLFAKAFERSTPTDDCPAPEALLDALRGQVDADARTAIVDHMSECPVCAEAWRLARATGLEADG